MSFFKDFKSDITQAMNELMPDGNEVFEDDTTPQESKKKSVNTISNKKLSDIDIPDTDIDDLDDIAPEDMLDQIDELLNNELYSDGDSTDIMLDNDINKKTMDISVDDLLSQLSAKQSKKSDQPIKAAFDDDESLDDLLNSIADGDFDGASVEQQEPEIERSAVENDELNSSVIDDIKAEENSDNDEINDNTAMEETTPEESLADEVISEEPVTEEEVHEESTETEAHAMAEAEPEDTAIEDNVQEESEAEETEPEDATIEDKAQEEPEVEETEPDEVAIDDNVPEETVDKESELEGTANVKESVTDKVIVNDIKEDEPLADKDVISINQVEDKQTSNAEEKKVSVAKKNTTEMDYDISDADTETTYITKGTKIKGDIDTDGSIDVIGSVDGNVSCKGKAVVGGTVNGNITAGELYANGAHIEGDVKSYGSVKIGVGSMIIGGVEGESAVIAGAVNGDIDVKGPVIVDSTAVIMGNIKSRSVQINNGAVIEGFCSQSYSDIDVKSFFA